MHDATEGGLLGALRPRHGRRTRRPGRDRLGRRTGRRNVRTTGR
ncbi:hypothetical protein KM295_01260 [Natronomonas sp. F2-12]|uniref:Uncharacterized protein n=1 Tax=Natronomonas aquatica TaxID=2841590 RepID=A0A9R1CQK2_9EURY|nr:hypothetical protein [Natronomonas aquatica]